MKNIEDVLGHDTIIEEIKIDRTLPGEKDVIILKIIAIDGTRCELVFTDVYQARLNLNFGVIAEETIRDFLVFSDSNELKELIHKWERVGIDISDLRCYIISTNSTDSKIEIYARGYFTH